MHRVITYYQEDLSKFQNLYHRSNRRWYEHFIYTRNAIISILADLKDADAITARLMQNQDDIGMILSDFYDQSDVDQYVLLLKEHIAIAAELANAIKSKQDTTDIRMRWDMNGSRIVDWMTTINPDYWSSMHLSYLWNEHLDLTEGEMMARADSNWMADIAASDSGIDCIGKWADEFAEGIIYQNIQLFSISPGQTGVWPPRRYMQNQKKSP